MSIEQFLAERSIWVFMFYIIVYHGIIPAWKLYVPMKISKMKTLEERAIEAKEKELDIQERQLTIFEMMGKTLALVEMKQEIAQGGLNAIQSQLGTIQQSLVLLVDREREAHKGRVYKEITQEVKPIPRSKGELKNDG